MDVDIAVHFCKKSSLYMQAYRCLVIGNFMFAYKDGKFPNIGSWNLVQLTLKDMNSCHACKLTRDWWIAACMQDYKATGVDKKFPSLHESLQ